MVSESDAARGYAEYQCENLSHNVPPTQLRSITQASRRLRARGRSGYCARAFAIPGSNAPCLAIDLARMAKVIVVPVHYPCARSRLQQDSTGTARFAKHATVRHPVTIRSDVAACDSRFDTVAIHPPRGGAFLPVLGLELDLTQGAGRQNPSPGRWGLVGLPRAGVKPQGQQDEESQPLRHFLQRFY